MVDNSMTMEQLRDPGEISAKTVLTILAIPIWLLVLAWIVLGLGAPLVIIGFAALIGYLSRLFVLAYIKIHAVRCSPKQFPEIFNASVSICNNLNIPPVDVYILQDNVWNAFAGKLAGKRIVVLLSGSVDSLLLKGDMKQVFWLLGHEIGHHAAGHFGFWRTMISLGGWLPWFYLWYSRRGELTCDRVGLYASGSLSGSIKALCNMTVGAQLAEQVNVEEVLSQWQQHRNEWFVKYRIVYSTHPPHLMRFEKLIESASTLNIPN